MSTEPDGALAGQADGDAPLDLATTAALIESQRAKVLSATDVDGRLLFGLWGGAWLLGFGLLWATALDDPLIDLDRSTALGVFMVLILSAVVLTTVHVARRSAGVRGTSAQQGAMYGWAWFLAFLGVAALGYALGQVDVDPVVYGTVMTVVPPIIVGALYMAGGAVWRDRMQFMLGAWICVVTIAAAVVGYPHMLLVMAVAGGGGMLVAGAVEAVRRRARR